MNKGFTLIQLLSIFAIIFITITLLFLITGCKKDNRKCIESHTETKMLFIPNGRGITMIPTVRTVCDKYEGTGENNDR